MSDEQKRIEELENQLKIAKLEKELAETKATSQQNGNKTQLIDTRFLKPSASISCYPIIVVLSFAVAVFISKGNFDTGFPIVIGSLIVLGLYFLPTILADNKRTSHTLPIFALNLLLGFTLIAWVICLIWALMLPGLHEEAKKQDLKSSNIFKELSQAIKEIQIKNKEKMDAIQMPEEIRYKFNWGACFFNWIWGIVHKQFKTLIIIPVSLIPILGQIVAVGLMIWYGIQGNLWAWETKKWNNVESFNKSQQKWATFGTIIFSIAFIILISFGVFAITKNNESVSQACETIIAETDTKKIEKAIKIYQDEQINEKAKELGVSKTCAENYMKVHNTESYIEDDLLKCSSKEKLLVKEYINSLNDENYEIPEILYSNNGMPKSLVLAGVPIMCYEKANLGDNSKCTSKQLVTIKTFFENNKDIDWGKEYFEY